jgi:hypothetical protein
VRPIVSATVIAYSAAESGEPRPREELVVVLAARQCLQMQMLRLLDGSEDSPHPGWKQANPPATLWINSEL